VSEKFGFDQCFRNGRTVYVDERTICAQASIMNRTSDQFLARSSGSVMRTELSEGATRSRVANSFFIVDDLPTITVGGRCSVPFTGRLAVELQLVRGCNHLCWTIGGRPGAPSNAAAVIGRNQGALPAAMLLQLVCVPSGRKQFVQHTPASRFRR